MLHFTHGEIHGLGVGGGLQMFRRHIFGGLLVSLLAVGRIAEKEPQVQLEPGPPTYTGHDLMTGPPTPVFRC